MNPFSLPIPRKDLTATRRLTLDSSRHSASHTKRQTYSCPEEGGEMTVRQKKKKPVESFD
jgi:hypothetical protein